MRFIFLFVLICTMQMQAAVYSQTDRMDLSVRNGSIRDVLTEIDRHTKYKLVYSNSIIPEKSLVIEAKGITVRDVLQRALAGTELSWELLENDLIAIKPRAARQNQAGGIVLDEYGNPLAGVSISIKDWRQQQGRIQMSTATDRNGHWSLMVPNDDITLVFTFLGYKPVEYTAKQLADQQGAIRMEPAAGSLEEVVVIGYGTTTRRTNTGAVSSITADDIAKQTVGNPMQALPGRIAGMTVVQNNGLPGSNTQIQIRGNNTLGANGLSGALPLYVVDGVPFTNFNGGIPATDNLNAFGITGAMGGVSPFSVINPQDIERIDVLKDADATAIFGARGANGVVMITTKKGRQGRSAFNVNLYSGFGKVGRFVDLLDTEQYLELRREAFRNDGATPTNSNAPDLLLWDQDAHTDWQKTLIGGTAPLTDAQASYSGGTDNVSYFTSVNYRREGTVFPDDMGARRLSGRMTLQTSSANKRFNASFTANYANEDTDLISTDITSALSLPPNFPLYNPDGSLYWGGGFTNPLANLLKTYQSKTSNLMTNANLRYELFKGLNLKANLGYTKTNLDQRSANPVSSQNPTTQVNNTASFVDNGASNYIFEPQAEYTASLGEGRISALLGGTWQENLSEMTRLNGSNYTYEALLNTISGAGTVTTSNNYSLYRYASVFGRVNYDWKNKYILNLTFRRDGSSRFGGNNKFANFGAIGAAWVFSEETGMSEALPFLNFGKLRASYGTTGNDQLPNYQYLSLFGIGSAGAAYQQVVTLVPGAIANPNLKWETTRKLEFGLDLGFLEDRIRLTADMYWHRSSDLLTYVNLPLQVGANSYNANLDALVQNKGVEFELNTVNIRTRGFRWESAFNIAFQRNTLLSFGQVVQSFYASSFAIGYPANVTRLFSYAGVDPATGHVIINDLDGAPGFNFNTDRYFADIGTPFFGGLNNTFSYKGLNLDVFLQFNSRKGNTNSAFGQRIGSLNNQNVSALDRWRSNGDQPTWPAATAVAGGDLYTSWNNFGGSDVFWGNASFIKIRSASLSYTLPSQWITRAKLSNVRVFTQGQNLFTFAKQKYLLDPESNNSMPPLRSIVFGLNFTL